MKTCDHSHLAEALWKRSQGPEAWVSMDCWCHQVEGTIYQIEPAMQCGKKIRKEGKV